jgi:hypothetical protein
MLFRAELFLSLSILATAFAFCSAVSRSRVSGLIRRAGMHPNEVLAGPTVWEADLEAAALGGGLMFDDADAVWHDAQFCSLN